MKKAILILICLFQISTSAKWIPITKHISSGSINDIDKISENNFIATGDYGVVYSLIDDEVKLLRGNLEKEHLSGIKFINSSLIIAVGKNGTIIISKNMGKNWSEIDNNKENDYLGIEYINNTVFLLTKNKLFQFDVNNFLLHEIETNNENFLKLYGLNENLFIIGKEGLLLRINTNNYKTTKIEINTKNNISAIKHRGNQILISIVGEGFIKSEDFFESFEVIGNGELPIYSVEEMVWLENDRILAVGQPWEGTIRHLITEDFGKNWLLNKYPFVFGNKFYQDDEYSLLVGAMGRVVKINNEDTFNEDNFDGFLNLIHAGFNSLETQKVFFKNNEIIAFGQRAYYSDIININWKVLAEGQFDNYFSSNNEKYFIKEKVDIVDGKANWSYIISKLKNNILDTVQIIAPSPNRRNKKIETDNFILIYGSGTNYFIKYNDEEKFTEFETNRVLYDLSYDDGLLGAVTFLDGSLRFIYSDDLGATWINSVKELEGNSLVMVYKGKFYILESKEVGAGKMISSLIEFDGKDFRKLHEFPSKLLPIKLYVSDEKMVIIKKFNDVIVSTDGGKNWITETRDGSNTNTHAFVDDDIILIADGKEIFYNRYENFLTSIKADNEEKSIVYPNPCGNNLVIDFKNSYIGGVDIKIYNYLGIIENQYLGYKINLHYIQSYNLSNLAKGTYLIEVLLENGETMKQKFIKK